EVLFIGSSRFLDAIDRDTFSEKTGLKTINGSTTGLNLERLKYFAKIAAENEGLTHVILEASSPALSNGELDLPTEEEFESKEPPKDVEEHFQQFFVEHVNTLKYRKALRPKAFLKLGLLYTADTFDPDIWNRKGIARALFTPPEPVDVTDELLAEFQPNVIRQELIGPEPARPRKTNYLFDHLSEVSEVFADSDVKVIWVAPPVAEKETEKNSHPQLTQFYERTARKYGSSFYDYAGIGFDEKFLRDSTHLSADGRIFFSSLLAVHLADEFESEPDDEEEDDAL
ncbi:MAG: hypothetical protein HKN23_18420, partial [Verrucomicrobiales bacterium]|nr:hypothetical protein [Verrucomicrobiales bacterium]